MKSEARSGWAEAGTSYAVGYVTARRCWWLHAVTFLSLALGAIGAPVHAQTTLNWDPNGTTAGIGGNGTWDTTSNFWTTGTDGTSGVYQPWVNGNNAAVFR